MAPSDEGRAERPLCVLVADDEPLIVRVLERVLGRRGHQVLSAADAETALALLERHTFDVVLVDVHMPGDGHRVLEAFEKTRPPHGAAILMTGDPMAEHPGGLRLQKPFRYDEVVRLVERPSAGEGG